MRTSGAPVGHYPRHPQATPMPVKAASTRLDGEHLAALTAIVDRDGIDLWQPVLWPRQQVLAAEIGCMETDVALLLDQIREARDIKPEWHRKHRRVDAKRGRLSDGRPLLQAKGPKRKDEPMTTAPCPSPPLVERPIGELTLVQLAERLAPDIAKAAGATRRVWAEMMHQDIDPRCEILREASTRLLDALGRTGVGPELSDIRRIIKSRGWQGVKLDAKSRARRQGARLAGDVLNGTHTPPVSPHPTADADPDPLIVSLQNEVERLRASLETETECRRTTASVLTDIADTLGFIHGATGTEILDGLKALFDRCARAEGDVERGRETMAEEVETLQRQIGHLDAANRELQRQYDELQAKNRVMLVRGGVLPDPANVILQASWLLVSRAGELPAHEAVEAARMALDALMPVREATQ